MTLKIEVECYECGQMLDINKQTCPKHNEHFLHVHPCDCQYESGVEQGEEVGYEVGHEEGHNEGWQEGHDTGHDVGYQDGYDQGVKDEEKRH